jgi:subtilase family serine protease
MKLRVDNVLEPVAKATAGHLLTGVQGDLCVEATLPVAGEHQLSVAVDEEESQIESDESNNTYSSTYGASPATGPQTGPGTAANPAEDQTTSKPAPSPVPAPPGQTPDASKSADLTAAAIKVNGQAPDGKDDCKEGKNAVTVTVKNGGQANAGGFVVRLSVDGDQAGEEFVNGVEAGQEREVKFGDVKLKKGERELSATLDAKGAVAESNEENNERTATARCTAGA